jgi:hypothetical protein
MRIAIISDIFLSDHGVTNFIINALHKCEMDVKVEFFVPREQLSNISFSPHVNLAEKFRRRYKKYNHVFYLIDHDTTNHGWIYRFAVRYSGIIVLIETENHDIFLDEKLLASAKGVVVLSHEARQNIWRLNPDVDVCVLNIRSTNQDQPIFLDWLNSISSEGNIELKQLRRATNQAFAREIARFGIIPDLTDQIVKNISVEINKFF